MTTTSRRSRPTRRAEFAALTETSEVAQELAPAELTRRRMLDRAGWRAPAARETAIRPELDESSFGDETMIINLGPQHPSTHGVLRMMVELEGETVLRSKPVIGYLHTGMEKTGEELTYVQGATNVTRMDYLSPLTNELVLLPRRRGAPRRRAPPARRGSGC